MAANCAHEKLEPLFYLGNKNFEKWLCASCWDHCRSCETCAWVEEDVEGKDLPVVFCKTRCSVHNGSL